MRTNDKSATGRPRRLLCSILAVLLLLLGCSDTSSRDMPVGRIHLALLDDERTSWSGEGPRPLAATVWYPASPEADEERWQAGVFRFGYGAVHAPFLDNERRPLIVLSHGTGGSAAQLSWLAERLVMAGYIVAGLNHHGNTAVEERQWPAGFVLPWERSRDLSVLIDQLLLHAEIGPRIDRDRIGAAGFSLGGYSVLGLAGVQLPSLEEWERRCETRSTSASCQLPPEAGFTLQDLAQLRASDRPFQEALERGRDSVKDMRVSAVYAMAPALINLLSENDVAVDSQALRVVLAEMDAQISLSETKAFLDSFLPQATVLTVEQGTHYVFLASCSFRGKLLLASLCKDPAGVQRNLVHSGIGEDAIEFFNEHFY